MAVSWGFRDSLLVVAGAVVHLAGADRRGRDGRFNGEERPGSGRLRVTTRIRLNWSALRHAA